MSDETLCVTGCGRPAQTALCPTCQARLRHTLSDLPGMLSELEITATRQSSTTQAEGGRSKKAAYGLPFVWDAADQMWAMRNTVDVWAQHVADHREVVRPAYFAAACGWLASQIPWITASQDAEQIFEEITGLLSESTRIVDTKATRYAGPCTFIVRRVVLDHLDATDTITVAEDVYQCGADLRTYPGQKTIRCTSCGAEYDPVERAAWVLEKVRGELATGQDVAYLLSDATGTKVTWAMVRKMDYAGQLVHVTTDQRERKLYRVGDVLDIVKARLIDTHRKAG